MTPGRDSAGTQPPGPSDHGEVATSVTPGPRRAAAPESPPRFHHDDVGTPEQVWRSDARWASVPTVSLPPERSRLVVLAAHPDDETLGAAGLLALASRAGWSVDVVAATDGESSHPDSPTHTSQQLAARRRAEARHAVGLLAPEAGLHPLGLPDSGLAAHVETVIEQLVDVIGADGDRTLLVTTWAKDGHTDHEAASRAARVAAWRTDALVWEFPVWWWSWSAPDAAPWPDLRRLPLPDDVRALKARALAAHVSQVAPLSHAAGDEVLLSGAFLGHFRRDHETFLPVAADPTSPFEELHARSEDPWHVRDSWYERRKRALTLAALPRERYRRGVEVGASLGYLARDLAGRCDAVVALEESEAALASARRVLDGVRGVALRRARVPRDWPTGTADLIVVSELGYFLSPSAMRALATRVTETLEPGGALVGCHWRHDVRGWPLDADSVHAHLGADDRLRRVVRHEEDDVLLEVWARDA